MLVGGFREIEGTRECEWRIGRSGAAQRSSVWLYRSRRARNRRQSVADGRDTAETTARLSARITSCLDEDGFECSFLGFWLGLGVRGSSLSATRTWRWSSPWRPRTAAEDEDDNVFSAYVLNEEVPWAGLGWRSWAAAGPRWWTAPWAARPGEPFSVFSFIFCLQFCF